RADGLQLTGEGGLLQQLTTRVLESALEGEMTDLLGYEKHDRAGRDGGNGRNGGVWWTGRCGGRGRPVGCRAPPASPRGLPRARGRAGSVRPRARAAAGRRRALLSPSHPLSCAVPWGPGPC